MSWRYRKSINLGSGFRINLSKSGIGYSWGFPGYRVTKLAKGNTRKTYSFPGTGLSYVENYRKSINGDNEVKPVPKYNSDTNLIMGETEVYENTNVKELGNDDEILQAIKKLRNIDFFANVLLGMGLLIMMPIFIICPILGIVLKILLAKKWRINLVYEFDDFSKKKYDCLNNALTELSKSKKIWQINTSTKVLNTKYNSGAGHNVTRYRVSLNKRVPFYIKSNIDIYSLNLKGEKMIFTPDRIIYLKGFTQVYGRDFKNMYIGVVDTRFVESQSVASDAQIVDYTWKYVNKDGSPDRRFSNNIKYPVCKYGELIFKTEDGINICLNYSNVSLLNEIQNQFLDFAKYENEQISNSSFEMPEESPQSQVNLDNQFSDLYEEVKHFVVERQKASVSLIQRKFRLSYNESVRMMDRLEAEEIISQLNGNKPRKVLISSLQSEDSDNKQIEESIYDQIAEYKKLLDDGTLTQEEYDEIKKNILKNDER